MNARPIPIPLLSLLLAVTFSSAQAQNKAVKIGVLNDQSGVYADDQGIGSVIAAQLAVEDFPRNSGLSFEVITGDHQNKVDIGTTIARRWLDQEGVTMIIDVPNSAIALGVNTRARDANKVFIASGAGTAELDRQVLHAQYRALDLRHLGAWPQHCQGGFRPRRKQLVTSLRRTTPSGRILRQAQARKLPSLADRFWAPPGSRSERLTSHPFFCRRKPPSRK